MRRFVYNAKSLFTDIERRLLNGERIVTYTCQLPNCTPSEGKVFFYRQGEDYVVGICDNNNKKNIVYHGDCRDLNGCASIKLYFLITLFKFTTCFIGSLLNMKRRMKY